MHLTRDTHHAPHRSPQQRNTILRGVCHMQQISSRSAWARVGGDTPTPQLSHALLTEWP